MNRRIARSAPLLAMYLIAVAVVALGWFSGQAHAQHRQSFEQIETQAGVQGGGSQAVRIRLVQDDNTVNGTFILAVDARTIDLVANTFASATVDVSFASDFLSPLDAELGVLNYIDTPYELTPSIIGDKVRVRITSQGVGTGFGEDDGYEIESTYETIATVSFTINATFDAADFPIDCTSLSVGYYDSVDNSNDTGVILNNTTGAVPMTSVQALALRTLDLTADEGWRTLSGLPGMSIEDLLGQLSTRGFLGADEETGFPNVWRWDEATGWIAAASQAEMLSATDGIAFLALAVDGGASVRVAGASADQSYDSVTRTCSTFPLAFDVTYTPDGATGFEPGWNLEGNPTAGTLDWTATGWTRTSLTNTAYVYDAVSDQYLTNNGTMGTFDGLIAPLQGFWVKAEAGALPPALVAPEAALTSGGTFYGRSAELAGTDSKGRDASGRLNASDKFGDAGEIVAAGTPDFEDAAAHSASRSGSASPWNAHGPMLALRLEGEVQGIDRWAAAFVSFQAGGEVGLDPFDAEALAGLGATSLDLFTVLDDGTALEIDARPPTSYAPTERGSLEIPLAVEALAGGDPVGGKFTLSVMDAVRFPPGLRPVLVDTDTGVDVDLSSVREYTFELSSAIRSGATSSTTTSRFGDDASLERGGSSERRASEDVLGVKSAKSGKSGSDSQKAAVPELSVPVAQRGDATVARFILRFENPGQGASRSASDASSADKASRETSNEFESDAELTNARGAGSSLPEAYALESIYPNPFAGRVSVRYALPEEAQVQLIAYDLLGRRMTVLVDEPQTAGYHTAVWEALGLPSGVYILRLTVGEHTFAERVTLVR